MQIHVLSIVFVVAIILGCWGALVLFSHLSYRRAFSAEFLYKRYKRGLPYVTSEEAYDIANYRREQIERFLQEFGGEKFLPYEFLERPEYYSEFAPRRFEGDIAVSAWHAARLRDELTDARYLLAGRVIDLVTYFFRKNYLSEEDMPSSIRIEPIKLGYRSREMYPWRIVIESSVPDLMYNLLEPLKGWIGVGVDFAKPIATTAYRVCAEGNCASEGVVGGALKFEYDEDSLFVTCRHVLCEKCPYEYKPPTKYWYSDFTDMEPDVALLRVGGPYSLKSYSRVRCMNATDIQWARKEDVKFKKSIDKSRCRAKIDIAEIRMFHMGGQDYIGPHVLLTPHVVKRFWVYWPLFPRRFSRRGESGTWVVEDESNDWLGMVIGGWEPPFIGTVVLAGHHLLDGTGAFLNSKASPIPCTRR